MPHYMLICISVFSTSPDPLFVMDTQVPALQTVHHVSHNHKEQNCVFLEKLHLCLSVCHCVRAQAVSKCIFFFCLVLRAGVLK